MTEAPHVVVDASVAFKWLVSENEGSVEAAHELLRDHIAGRIRLVAPTLLAHELFGALARDGRALLGLGDAMDAFFELDVRLIAPDQSLFAEASRMVAEGSVSAPDSAYAALAHTLGCALVTADRQLARAGGTGLRVRCI